jgi:imidazolonepropionase-like amidohydrolase
MLTKVATSKEKILIKNVRVLDVIGGALSEPKNVLCGGGVIRDINADINTPDCDMIDGEGRTLMPGLIDCHAHILSPFLSEQKGFLGAWTFRQMKKNLETTLACGVVCVRDMLSTIRAMNSIREKIADGEWIGPTIFASGAVLSCSDGYPEFINPLYFPLSAAIGQPKVNITTPKQARAVVRRLKELGADHIKIGFTSYTREFDAHKRMPTITDFVFDSICKTAHEHFLKVAVHHNWSEDLVRILRHDIDTLEHLVYDRVIKDAEIELILKKGITVVPTLTISEGMARFEEKLDFLKSERAAEMFEEKPLKHLTWIAETWLNFKGESYDKAFGFWRANRKNFAGVQETARKLVAAGVPICAGTDLGAVCAFPGELPDEIKRLHNVGMSKTDAIRAATINAARMLRVEDRLGSVEPGRNSDIIIIDGNPLEDLDALRRVRVVGKNGSWFKPDHPEAPDFWLGHETIFNG